MSTASFPLPPDDSPTAQIKQKIADCEAMQRRGHFYEHLQCYMDGLRYALACLENDFVTKLNTDFCNEKDYR